MEAKFELYRVENGYWRIRALRSFGSVRKGDLGGFVRYPFNLSHNGNCWIGGNAKVMDSACVEGNAQVSGNAMVCDRARITDNAKVYGNAMVYGGAVVYGDARVCGRTRVSDRAKVGGTAKVFGSAHVTGGSFIVKGDYGKGVVEEYLGRPLNSSCGGPGIVSRSAVVNAAIQAARNRNGKDKRENIRKGIETWE